jgi:hypothetical protein
MEVGTINIISPHIKPVNADHPEFEKHLKELGINRTDTGFKFENAMMKPDDVKNFLYMIVAASGIHVIANEDKMGSAVNKLV